MTSPWQPWLNNIPVDEQKTLLGLLKQLHEPNNGHYQVVDGDDEDVLVTRTPAEELLVLNPPPYVDIFKLHDLYKKTDSNLLIKGPKGDGKSLSVFTYAAEHGIPLVVQECSEGTKETHLMGSQTLIGDKTVFVLGSIPTAIDVANECGECILLFEELNALTPQVQKMLNAVGDFRKACSMPAIKRSYRLQPGKKLWLRGTMNPSVYGGTYDLNEDLKSRFDEIEITYPEPGLEKQVLITVCGSAVANDVLDKVIRLGGESRQGELSYSLSTRDLVRLVQTIPKAGLPVALQLIACKFEGDDRENIIRRINSIFGNVGTKKYWS